MLRHNVHHNCGKETKDDLAVLKLSRNCLQTTTHAATHILVTVAFI